MDSDKAIRCALREAFGEDVIDASGCLVRETLAERAFRNADSLRTLNRIVWPGLIRALRESISAMQRDGTGIPIVVDMAVLYEAGCGPLFDAVAVVDAPKEMRIQRVMKARGWDRDTVLLRMHGQLDPAEKIRMADWNIRNSGGLDSLRQEAEACYQRFFGPPRDQSGL
jgi:dephospho-CoA kinase